MTISKIGGAGSNPAEGTIKGFRADVYDELCWSFGPLVRVEQTGPLLTNDTYSLIKEEFHDALGVLER